MMKKIKTLAMVSSFAVISLLLLAGCGSEKSIGKLTLSVNPEIQIEYNKDGEAISFSGLNDEGKAVVESFKDHEGEVCEDVVATLVKQIDDDGYFDNNIDGHARNVVLRLEPGSELPDDTFLDDVNSGLQTAMKDMGLSSSVVMVGDADFDKAYDKENAPSQYITLAKAKEIALAQAHVSASDAKFVEKEFDHDDGTPVFELEFTAGNVKYSYDVHAVSGKVIEAEHEAIPQTPAKQPAQSSGSSGYSGGSSSSGSNAYRGNSDYGPYSDGVTDYGNSDYGPNSDGVTNYGGSSGGGSSNTNYSNYGGNTNYDDGGNINYDDGNTNYDDGGNTNYDDGNSDYD